IWTRMDADEAGPWNPCPSVSGSYHNHFGFNGIGDEALFMRGVMQSLLVRRRGKLVATINNFRMKPDRTHPRHSLLVFGHDAHGFVMIAVHLEPLLASQIQIR